MKMKILLPLILFILMLIGCTSMQRNSMQIDNSFKPSDTIKISNEELDYEVIIIDPGFSSWLYSTARPRGYYSENYMQTRNRIYVQEWNNRVLQPSKYDSNLYEMQINYDFTISYGYEVNYLIFNYFNYFQITYKQQLGPFVPRP